LHRASPPAKTDPGGAKGPAWVLSVHHPDVSVFRDVSAANLQLIKLLQGADEFCRLLHELRAGWANDALIHGDVKADNVIAFAPGTSRRKTRLALVDWEMAGWGDACWDVGSVFGEYLATWLLSMPITGEAPPERFVDLARYPLEAIQPAIRAFWPPVRPPHGLGRAPAAPSPAPPRPVRPGAPDPNLLRVVTDRDAPHGDHPMHAAAESERPAATARGERSPAGSHVVRAVAGVSVYHAQVEAVVEAVEILSPTTYAWFDRESPALAPRIVRAMSTRTARDYLLYTLQRQLYADFYCQGFPIPTEEEDVPAFPQGTTSFLRSLSSANAGTGCREGNWEVRVVEEHA